MTQKSRRHLAILRQKEGVTPVGEESVHAKRDGVVTKSSSAHAGRSGGSPSTQEGKVQEFLQVGELAKLTGKTVRAIHLYEDMGLLSPVERSPGRYRLYNTDSVERVRWIMKLHALGFSLPDVKQLILEHAEASTGKAAANRLRTSYVEKLSQVQAKLAELHRLEQELLSSLTYLDACQSACEGDLDRDCCPECSLHVDQPSAPSLVSGVHIN